MKYYRLIFVIAYLIIIFISSAKIANWVEIAVYSLTKNQEASNYLGNAVFGFTHSILAALLILIYCVMGIKTQKADIVQSKSEES